MELRRWWVVVVLVGLHEMAMAGTVAPVPMASAAGAQTMDVRYDPQADRLTLNLENASLLAVLAEVQRQSGVDMRVDPAVERAVALSVKDLPMDAALDRLTTHLNVIKGYGSSKAASKGKSSARKSSKMLITVVVLPEGKVDQSRAVSALDMDKEMANRALTSARQPFRSHAEVYQLINARWQARMEKMSPERRKLYEEKLAAEQKRQQEADAARQARESAREVRAQASQQRREARNAETSTAPDAPDRTYDPALAEKARQQFPQKLPPAVKTAN